MYEDELYHHGIKGQKWGVRRYQNADGSLTTAGRRRIGKLSKKAREPFRDMARAKLNLHKLDQRMEQGPDPSDERGVLQMYRQYTKYGQDYSRAVSRLSRLGLNNPSVSIREEAGESFVMAFASDPVTRVTIATPFIGTPSFGPRVTGQQEADFWRALARNYSQR